MDYPKSVPSIGLVDGKFVDENPLTGTPGSLIPSQWGNSITDEVLNVVSGAGLTPSEEDNTQLRVAINQLVQSSVIPAASKAEAEAGTDNVKRMTPLRVFQAIAKVVGQATEAVLGWAKVATQAQTDAGEDDATMVTPKKLRMGVVWNFGANGYLALPSWLGGVIIQWGQQTAQVGTAIAANAYPFPMAFPNQIFRIIGDRASEMQNSNNPSTAHYFTANTINWSVTHVRASGSVAIPFVYLAIGR